MAVVVCRDCGKSVSADAAACPECGRPMVERKKPSVSGFSKFVRFCLWGLLALFIGGMLKDAIFPNATTASKPLSAEEQKRVAKHGSAPERSEFEVQVDSYLKATLKDPDSLKVYSYSDVQYNSSDGWLMLVDYGAKNSFGGMVRSEKWFVIHKGRIKMSDAETYR